MQTGVQRAAPSSAASAPFHFAGECCPPDHLNPPCTSPPQPL